MKNRFSRQQPWRPSLISDRNNFSYFTSTSHTNASYQLPSQMAFRFSRRNKKIDFQNGGHGGHLGFLIEMIFSFFYLQVTSMLPTKFQVYWPYSLGEEATNRFFKKAAMAAISNFRSEQF